MTTILLLLVSVGADDPEYPTIPSQDEFARVLSEGVAAELTPVGNEAPKPASISVPTNMLVGQHYTADMEGISLNDIAQGNITLRIYPPDRITVLDGISFIKRAPYITLFPQEPGTYYMVFVLHTKDLFVEQCFTVTTAAAKLPETETEQGAVE